MKLRSQRVLVLTLITLVFSGCKSNPSADTALPATGEVDSSDLPNKHTDNDKGKLLDMAIKLSGQNLSADEQDAISRMFSLNEKDLLKGLGIFLELSDGYYPNSLDTKTVLMESDKLAKKKGWSPQSGETRGKIHDLFFASAFYKKLAREKKDVVYYGNKVKVEDSDTILIRWRISKNQYRVIYGNLTTENIPIEQLTELEATISK
ncbi:MAG: hypothetical protein ABIG61_13720 [Planctomycetota bacterium]